MIDVLAVIGTRPEAIKMAPVVHALNAHPKLSVRVCATGQHREMLDSMLGLFGIEPDFDLDVMRPGQTLTGVTQAVLEGMEPILRDRRPDWVLVQGDTTTVMAATMAAFYEKISVGHVEAGLRTFDKYSPFPEEINRRVAGVVADLHFAPTQWAAENLRREGVPDERIFVTGNTVIDSLRQVGSRDWDPAGSELEGVPFGERRIVLATAHRSENHGGGMREIALGLCDVARSHPDVHIVYPVHLNPRAREAAYEVLGDVSNVSLTGPLDYQPLVWLLHRAHLVITDSGGIQEEAAALGKPVLVLRETTERPEGVDAGIARLIGARREALVRNARRLLDDELEYQAMASTPCPYGDGTAGRQIAELLEARHAAGCSKDHIYEQVVPAHPLDSLVHSAAPIEWLRDATADIPQEYADVVMKRFARRTREEVSR